MLELTARIPLLPHLQIVLNRIFRVLASLRAWEYGAGSAPIRFTFVPQCPEGRTARSRTSAAHVAGPHCHRQIAIFRDFPYVRRRDSRYSQCGFHAAGFLSAVRTSPPNPLTRVRSAKPSVHLTIVHRAFNTVELIGGAISQRPSRKHSTLLRSVLLSS